MKVIVDANIVLSALLTPQRKIADILTNPDSLELIAPSFLRSEIIKHRNKIIRLARLMGQEIDELEFIITRNIRFISEDVIDPKFWKHAQQITSGVDESDTPYVAYALHFRSKIWTGDKKLIKGLEKVGFNEFVTTVHLLMKRKRK